MWLVEIKDFNALFNNKPFFNYSVKCKQGQSIAINIKQKVEIKMRQMNKRYFFESNFVGDKILFFLVHSNQDNDSKRFKTQRYYLG